MGNEQLRSVEVIDRLNRLSSEFMAVSQILEGIQAVGEHERIPLEQLSLLERLTCEYSQELRVIADNICSNNGIEQ